MNTNLTFLFNNVIIAFTLVLVGCGGSKKESNPVETVPASKQVVNKVYHITDVDQAQIASISIAENSEIHIGKKYLFRECKDKSKCKYLNENGETEFEVKHKEEGFKIRDPQGKLLVKVKTSENKLKIGFDEEMIDPYKIKQASPDKTRLELNDSEVGQVRMGQAAVPMKVTDGEFTCFVAGPEKSPEAVVLILPETELTLRVILLTELLRMRQ